MSIWADVIHFSRLTIQSVRLCDRLVASNPVAQPDKPDLKTQQSTPSDRAPRIPTILRGIPLAFPRRTAPILFSLSSSVKSVRSLRLMSCPRMSGPCNCTHKSSEDYRSVSPEQENAIFLSLLVKPRPALAT